MPFFGTAASATTTLVIAGGGVPAATTVNVPELLKLAPFESFKRIEYVWLPADHVPIGHE